MSKGILYCVFITKFYCQPYYQRSIISGLVINGSTKGANLYSVREFGNDCLLYTLDELLRYGDVLNIIQADERNRVVERKDVPLFDDKAFREAIINAILHNAWVEGNEPMVTVYSDRIEIMSRGTLAPKQTINGNEL